MSPGAQTALSCPLHAENARLAACREACGKSETGGSSRGWHGGRGRGRARDTLGAYATPRLDAPKRTARLARLHTGVTRAVARTVHDQRLLKGRARTSNNRLVARADRHWQSAGTRGAAAYFKTAVLPTRATRPAAHERCKRPRRYRVIGLLGRRRRVSTDSVEGAESGLPGTFLFGAF